MGSQVAPFCANFLFFKLPSGLSELVQKLLARGVIVKGLDEGGMLIGCAYLLEIL